jgi:periplasmic protein TonB
LGHSIINRLSDHRKSPNSGNTMKNEARALTESFFLHSILVGIIITVTSSFTPLPDAMRFDVSLLEYISIPAHKEQTRPSPPAVQEQPIVPPPAPAPRLRPKATARVSPRISKPLPITPQPEVAAVGSQAVEQPDETPAQLNHTAKEELSSPQVNTPSEVRNQLSGYLNLIRTRIESRKRYPLWATTHKLEGEVSVRFIITPEGQITTVTLKKSSGCESLDQAALEAVQESAPMPRPPDGLLTEPTPMELTIIFQLT